MTERNNNNWKERFILKFATEYEKDDLRITNGKKYDLTPDILDFIEQIISENWQEFEKERTIHKMELDAISLFSVEDFIKWKEHKLQTLNK